MLRRIALVTSGALALSVVIMYAGTAAAKPVTGNVSCTLTGSATVSPGLPLNSPGNATKKLKTTVTFTGTLSNCTGAQANTKGGAQIDGGSVSAVGKTITAVGQPLPSCLGLANPTTPTVLKSTITFTSGGAKLTNSKVNLTIGAANLGPPISFDASGPVSGGAAFKGQNLSAIAVLDDDAAGFATKCTSSGGLSTLNFTGLQGRSSLVTP